MAAGIVIQGQHLRHREHHVWCNFYYRPVEGCRMCERLWKSCPYDSHDEIPLLHKKYFIGIIKRA